MSCLRSMRLFIIVALCCAAMSDVAAAGALHGRVPRVESASAKASQAVEAFFARSDLDGARAAARTALEVARLSPSRANRLARLDALFVEMEAAALQADTPAELQAALRLCELPGVDSDPRVGIAAARILDLAANTTEFRPAVPRILALLTHNSAQSNFLRSALLAAAADGMPGLSVLDLARESGLLGDWRLAGPFGRYPNVAFDREWAPEHDGLTRDAYDTHPVEHFRFAAGTFTVPEYFSTDGVLYAAAESRLTTRGEWRLRVESAGTLEVFLDGVPALTKDSRFRATPEIAWRSVQLPAGTHRILVKFTAASTPFRIAVVPSEARPAAIRAPADPAEAAYVSAARDYWAGDYEPALEQLTKARDAQPSASVDVLLAQVWSRLDEDSSEQTSLLQDALRLAPSAVAVEYEIAEKALSAGHAEDALEHARSIVRARPSFEPGQRLLATSAVHLDAQSDAAHAYERAIALHPSCSLLRDASRFFASLSDYGSAARLQMRLRGCAPGALAWAESLVDAGRHSEAASAAAKIVAEQPLDRAARALLVRELSRAGENSKAVDAARQLTALAPNSPEYRRTLKALQAGDISSLPGPTAIDRDQEQFFTPFRRDGVAVVQQTRNRHFSGGPAVVLLHDRVAQLTPDNSVAYYFHNITRVLDRDGILQYGEVSIPERASILELRTIKADGTIAEPEFNQHKSTISMPALAPGDAIDVEYIVHYTDGGLADHNDAFQFTFGSLAAPVVYSRFVALSPADADLQFVPHGDVPSVQVRSMESEIARIWERNDIAQFPTEVAMPRTGVLPGLQVYPAIADGWAGVRDFYRNALINAAQIGSRTDSVAREIAGANDELRLRAAYRRITSRIRPASVAYSSGEFPTAENTLATYTGSRSVALIALARALGMEADLIMARDSGSLPPSAITPQAYTRPVVLVHLTSENGSSREIVLDPDDDGIGFGGLSPTIERADALLVPLHMTERSDLPILTSIARPLLEDRSVADGDVSLDEDGNLSARIRINMGVGRSAQMRSILSGIAPDGRKHFFEQLAMRIFPGASDAVGEVRNESDPDNPLELVVSCRATHFVDFTPPVTDLDQLVPALGLRKMYLSTVTRRSPLYVDTPLIETSTFRVHLPENAHLQSMIGNMTEENEFGSYSATFSQQDGNVLEIRRDFRIPVQLIQPARFEAFSRFARRVDDLERQRFTIERAGRATVAAR